MTEMQTRLFSGDLAAPMMRHVFVRNLKLNAFVGVYKRERQARQPIRINVDLAVRDPGPGEGSDKLDEVVCYEQVVRRIESVVAKGHVNLVETLAERIAQDCLGDHRVERVRVCIEKLTAIENVDSVGIAIERVRVPSPAPQSPHVR